MIFVFMGGVKKKDKHKETEAGRELCRELPVAYSNKTVPSLGQKVRSHEAAVDSPTMAIICSLTGSWTH